MGSTLRIAMAQFDFPVGAAVQNGERIAEMIAIARDEYGADVVLFCVKSSDTEDAARQMRPHLAPGTLVLTLQNGVDNDERVRAVLHASTPVAAAVVYVATAMGGSGHVVHHGRGELVIAPSPRSDEVARQLTAAGIPTQVSDNVRGALWAKLMRAAIPGDRARVWIGDCSGGIRRSHDFGSSARVLAGHAWSRTSSNSACAGWASITLANASYCS